MKENIINVLVKKEAEIDRDFEVKVEISMVQEYCELAPPPGELSARVVTDKEEYS